MHYKKTAWKEGVLHYWGDGLRLSYEGKEFKVLGVETVKIDISFCGDSVALCGVSSAGGSRESEGIHFMALSSFLRMEGKSAKKHFTVSPDIVHGRQLAKEIYTNVLRDST
jgi:hypothetical protein